MVVPKKNASLTKDEEVLKKKLRKLFKLENSNSEPSTSISISTNGNQKTKTAPGIAKPKGSANPKTSGAKLSPVGNKRKAPLNKNTLPPKVKKYETESPDISTSNSSECYSDETGELVYKRNSKIKVKSAKRESTDSEPCDTSDSEELKQLAITMQKKEQRNSKSIKSKEKSSYTNEKVAKQSINKNKNSTTSIKEKITKKSETKTNKKKNVKKPCKDYDDSSESFTDDTRSHNDSPPGPSAPRRKSNKSNKSKNDNWKIEKPDTISSTTTDLIDNCVISKQNLNLSNKNSKNQIKKEKPPKVKLEMPIIKSDETEKYSNINGNKSKKHKETELTKRKIKETNQKLVPYRNSCTNLPGNGSAEEQEVEEIMKFYGLESTDEDDDDEGDDNDECSDEYDSEETDSDENSCEEEDDYYDSEMTCEDDDYDSEFTSNSNDVSSEDNENYDFESESDDEDYNLPENCEDLYIRQGTATKYDINGYDVEFDSENEESQIIEIPIENQIELNVVEKIRTEKSIQNYESDDSCPQLVPISFETEFTNDSKNSDIEMFDFSTDDNDLSESEYSDCCSEYSEATEGSLCFEEKHRKDLKPPKATTMLPEIFDLSSENLQNSITTLNQIENCHSENDSDMELDNPLEKIINNSCNSSKLYKIKTIKGVEFNNITNSKESPSKVARKAMKNNIFSEFVTDDFDKFGTKFYNAIDSCHVLVLLRDPIYIYGTIKLKLLAGTIEIFGYQPDLNETLEIFSPRGYSYLDIKSINNKKMTMDKSILSNILFKDNYESIFLKFDLNDIIETYNSKTDSIILLTRNDCNKKIEMLRKYMKENLFPNMNSITLDRPFYSSEFILHCLIRIQSQNSILIDPKWQTIKLQQNTKSMIIGGKSVGKSTLLRYLINKNLKEFKKILLIDLDIGQPELFIPQTISVYVLDCPLLGPGYYLGLEPKKSLLFGDLNVILSPIDYLKNLQNLLKYCKEMEEFQNIPWIINTMGYVKGFGNELIAAIIKYLQPTDIIQLQSSKSVNNFDYLMYPNVVETIPMNVYAENDLKLNNVELKYHLILFDSIMNGRQITKSSEWDMKSKDMRYAMIVTRLGAVLNKCDWLTDVKPVCAPIDDIEIISFSEDHLTKEELLDVINANLVYLCNKSAKNDIDCYGIGIVRGIDRFQRKIYLLPAVPLETLANVNCFAFCNIPLPTSILLNQGPKVKGIVPYAYNTNKVIASKSVNQLYNRGQKKK